jgi:cephalosporin hydroxylase
MRKVGAVLRQVYRLLHIRIRPKTRDVTRYFRPENRRLLEADKWALSEVVIDRLVPIVGVRPYPLDELLLMATAFQYHLPDVVIDIGTHVGKSARIWFELARYFQSGTTVHTVDKCDPNHPEYPGSSLGKFIRGTPVKQHVQDGYACACDLIAENPTAGFLIFLDSDHEYQNVRRELELVKKIQRGCLLVHDTFYQPGSHYNHGPYLAIQDCVVEAPVRQVFHLQTGLPGMSYLGLE